MLDIISINILIIQSVNRHVVLGRNTKIVVEEINNINCFRKYNIKVLKKNIQMLPICCHVKFVTQNTKVKLKSIENLGNIFLL